MPPAHVNTIREEILYEKESKGSKGPNLSN